MFKIIKFLKGHVPAALLVAALLIAQVTSELALPQYTSDIVDVGIQQSGIEYAVPERISAGTLDDLTMFLGAEDAELVRTAYAEEADGELVLNDGVDRAALEDVLTAPEALLYSLGEEPDELNALREGYASGLYSEKDMLELCAGYAATLESDSILTQRALLLVKAEYAALGVDVAALQNAYLWNMGLKMLLLTLATVAAAILAGLIASRTAAAIGRDLRAQVFKQVLSYSGAELDGFSTASLITRSTNDVQQVQQVLVMMLRIVMLAPIMGIGGILKVVDTNTGMGWIIAIAVGAVFALVGTLMSVTLPKFKLMQTLVDRLNLVSREILTGVPVIRAFSREEHEKKRFDAANTALLKTMLFTNRTMNLMPAGMSLIMNGITLVIVWVGARGVDLGTMQVGDMIAFINYTMQIVMSFMMLTMISIMLPRAAVAAGRIDEVLKTTSRILEPAEPKHCTGDGLVRFEDVSFRYPNAENEVLEHISFMAEPGRTTAIIGSTGSGKSTLLNLIPRFYDVTGGRITIDGVDVRDLPIAELRGMLGYVPQQAVLFSGTVESNIKFADETLDDAFMRDAAAVAQAEEFITEKPEGYASPIAQGGSNVSGGQKQRLSIARAVAKAPHIYLFDDSFSALDYKTEVALRRALSTHVASASVIVVAQRISTILHADRIVVLDDGRIAGIGTHSELMASCQTYQEIARSQLSASELGEGEGA